MFIIFLTLMSFCAEALMLPPGFVVRQFGHTRDKLSTAKIEEKVSYKDFVTFNETVLFRSANKYRVVISNNDATMTLVRNGDKCVIVSSQKRMDLACTPLNSLFYHNLLLSSNDAMIAFIKQLKINPRENIVSIKTSEDDGSYIAPEGIVLVNYNSKPMYLIGVTDSMYKGAIGSVSGKPELSSSLVEELKYKTPQIWADKNNFWPLRIFGQNNDQDFELTLGSYITDGNEVPFPKAISLTLRGNKELSFNVSTFETGVEIKDDNFVLDGFKKLPLMKQEDLTDAKSKMVDYLREYR